MRFLSKAKNRSRATEPDPGGFTLLELVIVLALVGLVVSVLTPLAASLGDRMAVQAARESVVGVFHRARLEAVSVGESRIVLTAAPARVELWSGGILRSAVGLGKDFGVHMELSGDGEGAEIRFGALGLGRVASQTIRFSRGAVQKTLVVSSYGRVARP